MKVLPRFSQILLVCSLILVCTLVVMLIPSPGRADVGVRPVLPGGSNLLPDEDTPIQMAAETVVMNVRAATAKDNEIVNLNPDAYGLQSMPVWYPAIAEVQADFTMRNPTSEAINLTVWFPLASALEKVSWELNPDEVVPRIASFEVAVNGNSLDYTVSELPNPQGEDRPLLPWASFPVSFPAGEDTLIQVSYVLPLSQAVKGYELALYYIFQTGAGWAGPIGQAELILNLPYPASTETLSGMSSTNLVLPYAMSNEHVELPSGAVLEGNQARWSWTDFEPGPEDDFAIWLMNLDKWQAIQTAKAAVQANPQDGQAWLDLALIYHSLSAGQFNRPATFSKSYVTPGIEAYQKAAALLPDHPVPHAGIALLSLIPYMSNKDAPAEVLNTVQEEFSTARDLEEKNPSLSERTYVNSWTVEEVLGLYAYNEATATADWVIYTTEVAKETQAVIQQQTTTPTPTQEVTLSPTSVPSKTPSPLPLPTNSPAPISSPPEASTGGGTSQIILIGAVVIGLLIIAYLAYYRLRSGAD